MRAALTIRAILRRVGGALGFPWFAKAEAQSAPAAAAPVIPADPEFERLRALASSGVAGCTTARRKLREATLRGLARCTGKPMPGMGAQ